jgi:myo-inositol-hexaphosphate 3-phosphohydrolase
MSLRELAWPMARLLQDGVRLNLMSLEALAAAERQRAELCLAAADENPQLLDAAAARGTPARLVGN